MRKRVFLVLLVVNQIRLSRWWTHLKTVKSSRRKSCNDAWSEHSVYIQLIIFPVEFNIVQVRLVIPTCVHIVCAYTWKRFVPHIYSPFQVGSNWNLRWMIIQKVLFLRQQQAPSCKRNILGTYRNFLDDIFYSQSNWIWCKVNRPLNTVVGVRENQVALP